MSSVSQWKPPKKGNVLVLRNCKEDFISYDGFKYPTEINSVIESSDWVEDGQCGNGLHGILWGVGTTIYFYTEPSIWFVIEVNPKDGLSDLGDKVKFKKGIIRYIGVLQGAVELLYKYAPPNSKINYISLSAGNYSTLSAGSNSTLSARNNSTLSAGNYSTLSSGNDSTLSAVVNSNLSAGNYSTLSAGNKSTLSAGYNSTVTIRYFNNGEFKVSVRVITKEEANKPYKFVNGEWTLVSKENV